MLEAQFEDTIVGASLISFDGRVVELFEFRSAEAKRLHISMLFVDVEEPGRRGNRAVWFTGGPKRKGGGFRLTVSPDDWPQVQYVVDAAREAVPR